ncbi:MAG: FAD-binding oxidoreductase [Pseudomonadota bacterium]
MNRCTNEFLQQAGAIVGAENLAVDEKTLRSGSRDCFHFSPVLVPLLESCQAEAIAYPESEEQLVQLVALAVSNGVPVTPRGGGTGNYGQGVPLQGGLMINTKRMNRIVDLKTEAARVEAGVSLWTLEAEAAAVEAELRMFPSTIATSSAAGFITGGSGGIGSIEWGMLRDGDNIRHARIVTAEATPQVIDLNSRDELLDVLHNCGLTAFVTEVTFAMAPKTQWHQHIFAFDSLDEALTVADEVANDKALRKRLVTAFEWPIPSFFKPLVRRGACPEGKALLFLITDLDEGQMADYMVPIGGQATFYLPPPEPGSKTKGFQIYEFTWNHTTQWAMKADPNLTYLQEGFATERLQEQLRARRERFGDQVSAHVEFTLDVESGSARAGGLSIVDFRGKDQLWELIAYCEDNEIRISNPHTHFLDDDTRWYGDNFLKAKDRWDPHHLLNPGHLHALE